MAGKTSTVYATGYLYWAKIVGDKALVSNYDGNGKEWAFEFEPDDPSFLKEHKLLDRLKDKPDAKNPDKGEFLFIKKAEFNKDGEKNEPFRIYDIEDNPWDDRLIGNRSRADVKLNIVDWGVGKKKSIYAVAIRITDLVPYVSNEFAGMSKSDETPKKAPAKSTSVPHNKNPLGKTVLEDLDDDLPFD